MQSLIPYVLSSYRIVILSMQDKLYHWILRKYEEQSRVTIADIMAHIQVQTNALWTSMYLKVWKPHVISSFTLHAHVKISLQLVHLKVWSTVNELAHMQMLHSSHVGKMLTVSYMLFIKLQFLCAAWDGLRMQWCACCPRSRTAVSSECKAAAWQLKQPTLSYLSWSGIWARSSGHQHRTVKEQHILECSF